MKVKQESIDVLERIIKLECLRIKNWIDSHDDSESGKYSLSHLKFASESLWDLRRQQENEK